MGAGTSPAGLTQAGFPDLITGIDPTDQNLFFDRSTNSTGTANKLNLSTLDYELDSNGRPYGTSSKSAKVLIALLTEKGSAADINFGMTKPPALINDQTLPIVEQYAREALDFMVRSKEIIISEITAESAGNGRILLTVSWIDNSTFVGTTTRLEV